MNTEYLNPWKGARWIAIDAAGAIHARIDRCSRERAEAIARVMFPELVSLRIAALNSCDRRQSHAAEAAPLLTAESCERQGIVLPEEVKPPLKFLEHKLKQRFPHTRAWTAGGER